MIHMLSFLDFLHERFLRGIHGNFKYTEIFKNPTADELEKAAEPSDEYGGIPDAGDREEHHYFLGAFIQGKDLYVWNRHNSEHGRVFEQLKEANILTTKEGLVSLYLYWYPRSKRIDTEFASTSIGNTSMKDSQVYQIVKAHPVIAKLGAKRIQPRNPNFGFGVPHILD